MNYKLVYSDELYHHGVKGMKWGVRRQNKTSAGHGQNTASRGAASPEQRKARIKKAAKIGVAVAGTALAAYGGYKVYKLQGEAVTSLGKKYCKKGQETWRKAMYQQQLASEWANQSDRYKISAGTAKNNAERSIFLDASKSIYKSATEKRAESDRTFDEAFGYINKARNKNYSRREVAREMRDIARKRRGR